MVSEAFVLAFLTTGAFLGIYAKLPRKVRKMLEKHALFTEIVAMLGTYILHGSTITALLASGMVGIFVTAALTVLMNPEKYGYVFVAKGWVVEKMGEFSDYLNDQAKKFVKDMSLERKAKLSLVPEQEQAAA